MNKILTKKRAKQWSKASLISKLSNWYKNLPLAQRRINYFKTDFKKDALISMPIWYTDPLLRWKVAPKRRIRAEAISKAFKNLGYNVDIYDSDYGKNIDFGKYDLVFGGGIPFSKSFDTSMKLTRILFVAGKHPDYTARAEVERYRRFNNRNNCFFMPKRFRSNCNDIAPYFFSNAIIALGNSTTASTYEKDFKGPIFSIPNISDIKKEERENPLRDYDSAKKNFVWIGGTGHILKGLDLCIEAFSELPDLNLHIIGIKEEEIQSVYEEELERPNIIHHGFLNIPSEEFERIMRKSSFVIYPSAAEGQAATVIDGMSTGLIPIISCQTGITLKDFGSYIDDDINKIKEVVLEESKRSSSKIKTESEKVFEYTKKNHNKENFSRKFYNSIKELLKKNE